MPQRNDTALLTMGTIPESHFQVTAGCNPTQMKCLFIMEDTESIIEELVTLLQAFPRGPICHTPGIAVVEKRYEPPMQLLDDCSNSSMPRLVIATTYNFPISTINQTVHHYQLILQTKSQLLYFRDRIKMKSVHFIHL
jgi:hypothetical protein